VKCEIALLLCVVAIPALAHDEDVPIQSASELRDWCRQETEAYFIGKGESPMNWTASYTEQGNTFHVAGKWRVSSRDVEVECRVARGARQKYASYQIHS
jgi:hypothetical protein